MSLVNSKKPKYKQQCICGEPIPKIYKYCKVCFQINEGLAEYRSKDLITLNNITKSLCGEKEILWK